MAQRTTRTAFRTTLVAVAAACAGAIPVAAFGKAEGGVYIAGAGFTFQQAAERGLSKNPGGRRFFLLAVPPETDALMQTAAGGLAAVRDRVIAANGVLYVCQRDIDNGRINEADLVPGVVKVRGWPPAGSTALPHGQRYFAGENPADFPASNNSLRRLRTTCSH
ncbi:MAG: hypothetical protein IT515_12820 [Burkholderiales bacterium]|nr:hypothetical protein [Burkholderiales bacterium]